MALRVGLSNVPEFLAGHVGLVEWNHGVVVWLAEIGDRRQVLDGGLPLALAPDNYAKNDQHHPRNLDGRDWFVKKETAQPKD